MIRRSISSLFLFALCSVVALPSLAAEAAPDSTSNDGDPFEGSIDNRAELEAATPHSANPYLNFLPGGVQPDYRYWQAKIRFDSWDRSASAPPFPIDGLTIPETEDNDTFPDANPLPGLSAGSGSVQITGMTDQVATLFPSYSAPESGVCSNDDFGSADSFALLDGSRIEIAGAIGDCSAGAADIDYYRMFLAVGDMITADIDTVSGNPDTYVIIYGPQPYPLLDINFADPYATPFDPDPYASTSAPVAGTYYVVVSSQSGTGNYSLFIGKNPGYDLFSVELQAGDVFSATSNHLTDLSIVGPDFKDRWGTYLAVSSLYPPESPLLRSNGGAEVSDVVRETGTHYLRLRSLDRFPEAYTLEAQVFRPATEQTDAQKIFVDFNGATINANALFDAGPDYTNVTLSPLSSFLTAWGLNSGNQTAVISEILAVIEENLEDLVGVHPAFSYELLNSRDHADPFGQPGVSRVIIGGTQAQLGINTIGVASAIDPGNYGLEDTAVILLDLLSGPAASSNSLNYYTLAPGTTMINLVGLAVGNIASHEMGHFFGSWHSQNSNSIRALVDQGGALTNILGSSDDIIGDGDDVDVDFREDTYSAGSGAHGLEDQVTRSGYALMNSTVLFIDGFESGNTGAWN